MRRDVGEFVFGADLNAPGMMVPGTADVMMANLCGQNPDLVFESNNFVLREKMELSLGH